MCVQACGVNALFVTGSVLFLSQERGLGLLAFLTGSVGMFLGQLGEIIGGLGRRGLERFDRDPWAGG